MNNPRSVGNTTTLLCIHSVRVEERVRVPARGGKEGVPTTQSQVVSGLPTCTLSRVLITSTASWWVSFGSALPAGMGKQAWQYLQAHRDESDASLRPVE